MVGVMKGDAIAAQKFATELGASYPILTGAEGTFDAWGVTWLPQAYLIDPEGNVVADDLGAIDSILAEKL